MLWADLKVPNMLHAITTAEHKYKVLKALEEQGLKPCELFYEQKEFAQALEEAYEQTSVTINACL